MDQTRIELLNIVTDLRRAVMEHYYRPSITSGSSTFISNIIDNIPKLTKITPNLPKYIDLDLLKNNNLPPLEKAEYLLMMANRLQHFLFQEFQNSDIYVGDEKNK